MVSELIDFYRALFDHSMTGKDIADIRDTTGKGWVLGNERFKQQIARTIRTKGHPETARRR